MTFAKGDRVLYRDEWADVDVVGKVVAVYESPLEPVDAFEVVPEGADFSVVLFENELTPVP
jgi:hypothetical protein